MSTQVAVFNPQASLPAFAKNREMTALTKALAGGGGQAGKRISVKGGVFRLISDGKEVAAIDERYLDVIVVNAAAKISRTYYAGAFDPEKATPPTCWSQDGSVPDPKCGAKQSPQCATCPQNEKGSGQGESKACAYNQRIAVVLANDPEGDVMQLQLASNSIFGKEEGGNYPLQAYARWLAAQNVSADEVITRMKFDTTVSFPKLYFKAMRWLTEEEHDIAVKQGETPDAKNAVQLTVAQTDKIPEVAAPQEEAPPPPPATKAKAAAAPAAPAEEAEPPAPEPTTRKAKSKEAPAIPDKGKLSEALSKWDDE